MCAILEDLRKCFSRGRSFEWFRTFCVGMACRGDRLGVTSAARSLGLGGDGPYESLLGVFRSGAWDVAALRGAWYAAIAAHADLVRVNGRALCPSDGVKVCKEAERQPGVKRMHQDSQDSSKGEYVFGHMFGCVGVLASSVAGGAYCLPACCDLQDGMRATAGWEGSPYGDETHVVQSMSRAYELADVLGAVYLLQDRYFLAVPAMRRRAELEAARGAAGGEPPLVQVVTKAKSNAVAYEPPPAREPGRKGRPAKKGAKVALSSLFSDGTAFSRGAAAFGGEVREVEYLARDLLWGHGLYMPMRFVLVRWEGLESILATTDLEMEPLQVVEAYGARFGIESTFRTMKQDVGAFGYRFWTRACPALDRRAGGGDPDPLSLVGGAAERGAVLSCAGAVDRFVAAMCVVTGVVQIVASRQAPGGEVDSADWKRCMRGQGAGRGRTRFKVSERTVMSYMRARVPGWVFGCTDGGPAGRCARFIRAQAEKIEAGRRKGAARAA